MNSRLREKYSLETTTIKSNGETQYRPLTYTNTHMGRRRRRETVRQRDKETEKDGAKYGELH